MATCRRARLPARGTTYGQVRRTTLVFKAGRRLHLPIQPFLLAMSGRSMQTLMSGVYDDDRVRSILSFVYNVIEAIPGPTAEAAV